MVFKSSVMLSYFRDFIYHCAQIGLSMLTFPHCISKDSRKNNFLLALDPFLPARIKSRTSGSRNMFYRTEVLTEF